MTQSLLFSLLSQSCHHLEKISPPPPPALTWDANEQEASRVSQLITCCKSRWTKRDVQGTWKHSSSFMAQISCHQIRGGAKESQQVFFATKKKRWTLRNPVITLLLKRERKARPWRTNYCHWQPFKAVKKPHSPSTSVFDCSFALVAPHG